jgi:hypothetical protein
MPAREARPAAPAGPPPAVQPAGGTLDQDAEDLARGASRSAPEAAPPLRVPGYALNRLLGRGTFGEVWHAVDGNTRREVAIKFFTRHRGLDWPLLKREVGKLVRVVRDRRVVGLLAVGWEADPPYYIMEYLDGGSLADRLRDGPLPAAEAVRLCREVAEALVYIHGKAILHCDLKPANVLLDERGQARVADFGQARQTSETGPAAGTLFYMAPELTLPSARPDVRSDLYSLGALLHAMLCGHPPHGSEEAGRALASTGSVADRLDRYRELLDREPPPGEHRRAPGVDPALAAIVDRCLARDPGARFQNAQQLLDTLDERDRRRARRPLLVFGLLGPLVLLLTMLGFGSWLWGRSWREATAAFSAQLFASGEHLAGALAAAVDDRLADVEDRVRREAARPELARLLADPAAAGAADGSDLARFQAYTDALYAADAPVADGPRSPETPAGAPAAPGAAAEERAIYSWVVADAGGRLLARSPPDPGLPGRNFRYREWFNGRRAYPPESAPADLPPRDRVGVSGAFASKARGSPILVSVGGPVWPGGERPAGAAPLGVLAATVQLRTLNRWLLDAEGEPAPGQDCPSPAALLVNRDELVRHPCTREGPLLEPLEGFTELPAVAGLLAAGRSALWADPTRDGAPRLAVAERLRRHSDWVVIVTLDRERALSPFDRLAASLRGIGWTGLGLSLAVFALLGLVLARLSGAGAGSAGKAAP